MEGLNLRELWLHADILDLNKLYCNDVNAVSMSWGLSMMMSALRVVIQMFETYGVEAGQASIIRELSAVFSVYGIAVNHRHLSIVADYMVCQLERLLLARRFSDVRC